MEISISQISTGEICLCCQNYFKRIIPTVVDVSNDAEYTSYKTLGMCEKCNEEVNGEARRKAAEEMSKLEGSK